MDMQTAYTQARMMKVFFRAFEQMEEVIAAAVAAEAQASTLSKQLKDLNEKTKSASARVTVSETAAEEAKLKETRVLDQVRIALAEVEGDSTTQIAKVKEDTVAAITEIGENLVTVQQHYDAERARLREEIKELDIERIQLENDLAMLKSRINKT